PAIRGPDRGRSPPSPQGDLRLARDPLHLGFRSLASSPGGEAVDYGAVNPPSCAGRAARRLHTGDAVPGPLGPALGSSVSGLVIGAQKGLSREVGAAAP